MEYSWKLSRFTFPDLESGNILLVRVNVTPGWIHRREGNLSCRIHVLAIHVLELRPPHLRACHASRDPELGV